MLKNSDTTLAYLAGLMDGEAYIGIKKQKAYACQGRKTPGYHARVQIRMVNEDAIRFLAEVLGGWYHKERRPTANRRMLFCYYASDFAAEGIIAAVLPWLRVKRPNAKVVLALRHLQREAPKHRTKVTGTRQFPNKYGAARVVQNKSFSDEYVAKCEALYAQAKALNH